MSEAALLQNGSTTGTVKFYNKKKGFGFVVTPEGEIHVSSGVAKQCEDRLLRDVPVQVSYYANGRGMTATNIRVSGLDWQTGFIKKWIEARGFGFIRFGDKDVFFHVSAVQSDLAIVEEMKVSFQFFTDTDGRHRAVAVRHAAARAKQKKPRRKRK